MVSVHVGGGGIRAAFISRCLDDMFDHSPEIANSIQVSSGVSAGSIVASCIATNTSLSEAIDTLNQKEFTDNKNMCSSAFTLYRMWNNKQSSFYNNSLLRNALSELFASKTCKSDLNISVAEAGTFKPVSWNVQKKQFLDTDLITASCSIPGLFAPMKLNSKYYIDAGTVQELDNESIKCSLQNNSIKLHIVCSCHPWKNSEASTNGPYHPEFTSMAKHLASMLWDTGVREAHYNKLTHIFGLSSFEDGRSMLCIKRNPMGFECTNVVKPSHAQDLYHANADFFVLMVAPTVEEYVGFEDATLLDRPAIRKPVIDKMLAKSSAASSEMIRLVSACNLGLCSKLTY